MSLVISLHRFRQDGYAEPFVANVHALGQLNAIFQTHLQAGVGGSPEALMALLRLQISPHITPLEESGLLAERVVAPLRQFVDGNELSPEGLREIAARVRAAHDFLEQADSIGFQASEYVPPGGIRTGFRRIAGMTGSFPSLAPPSFRGPATANGQAKSSDAQYIQAAVIETDFANYEEKSKRVRKAEQVTARLNRYFYAMQDVMRAYGAIQDNFIGDATLSYIYQYETENSERAVRMALDMQKEVARINGELRAEAMRSAEFRDKLRRQGRSVEDLQPEELDALIDEVDPLIFQMRLGINKGEINLAQLGKPNFFSKLTIIGSPVNTAARLESACPVGGVCVSDAILSDFPSGLLDTKYLGEVEVKKNKFNAHHVRSIREKAIAARKGKVQLTVRGRDAEIASLEAWMRASVIERSPHFALVQAGAGEGKSTVANALLERIQDLHTVVLFGQGDLGREMDQHFVIADMLRREASLDSHDTEELQALRIRGLATRAETDAQDDSNRRQQRELDAHLLSFFLRDKPLADAPAEVEYLLKNPDDFRTQTERMLARLFAGLGRDRPVLVLLDDMQWVDGSSRNLLHKLLSQSKGRQIMVLGLRRNEPFPEDEPDWEGSEAFTAHSIELNRLSGDSLTGIVQEILGEGTNPTTVEAILGRSAGNPLFAQEIAIAVRGGMDIDRLPGQVQELFQGQLQHLDDAPLHLLKVASVIGREFREEDLLGMGISEPTNLLPDLIARDFIVAKAGQKGTYQFRHDLLREALSRMMEEEEKRRLNVECATYFAKSAPDDFVTIATHYEKGEQNDVAAGYYLQAADTAMKVGDFKPATTFYEKAFTLFTDPVRKIKALSGWDEGLFLDNKYDAEFSLFAKFTDLIDKIPDGHREILAEARYHRAQILAYNNRLDEAEHEVQEGLKIYGPEESTKNKCALLSILGTIYYRFRLDYAKARAVYSEQVTAAKKIGDQHLQATATYNIGRIELFTGNYSESLAAYTEAGEVFRETGDLKMVLRSINAVSTVLMLLGEYERPIQLLAEGLKISKEKMHGFFLDFLLNTSAEVYIALERYDDAIRYLEEALNIHKGKTPTQPTSFIKLRLAMAYEGKKDWNNALVVSEQALGIARSIGDESEAAKDLTVIARVHLGMGNLEEALAASEQSVDIFERIGAINQFDEELLLTRVKILMATHRNEEALAWVERAKRLIEERALKITNEAQRKSFLSSVPATREIMKLWQILREEISSDLPVAVKDLLGSLDFYPSSTMPEEAVFAASERVARITKNDEDPQKSSAGVILDVPLASVLASLLTRPVKVPKNLGEIDGVWAKDIHWEPFVGQDGRIYSRVDWKVASTMSLHRVVFPLIGQQAQRQELLRGEIFSRKGSVFIELTRSAGTSAMSANDSSMSIDPELRPRRFQFGDVRFILVPTADNKTILVLEMKRGLYTQNPWAFLKGFVASIHQAAGNGG